MEIQCKRCGAAIAEQDVDRSRMTAQCLACRTVFDVSALLAPESVQGAAARAPKRPEGARRKVEMPPGFTLRFPDPGAMAPQDPAEPWGARGPYRGGAPAVQGSLAISRRWVSRRSLPVLLVAIGWNGFMLAALANSVRVGNGLMLLITFAHVLAGVVLAYWALAMVINRTTVTAGPDQVSVRHHPVPWWGELSVPTIDLSQLYCVERAAVGRHGRNETTYAVAAMLTDGSVVDLVSLLPDPEQAIFIEQQIEEHLGIQDRPVAGEYLGPA